MKRELFAFSVVRELPKASNNTFASIISCANFEELVLKKYFRISFDVSVFPAPDSPEIIIDCGF